MAALGLHIHHADASSTSSPSSSSSSTPLDACRSTTVLSNLLYLGDLTHLTWRAYRLPSIDALTTALAPLLPTGRSSTFSPFHSPASQLQQTLADAWPTALPCLTYHAQLDPSTAHPILILTFHLTFDSTPPPPTPTLPCESALSPWLVDSDGLPLPLSLTGGRLFSPSFSSSVLLFLSHALQAAVQRSLYHAAQPATPSPPIHFLLHHRSLCARILSPRATAAPPAAAPPDPLQGALSYIEALTLPLFEDRSTSASVPPPPPPAPPPPQPITHAVSSPSTTLTPLSVAATPSTSSSSPASDVDAMDQSDPPPSAKPPPVVRLAFDPALQARYTRPPSPMALQLPSYLHRFTPPTRSHHYALTPLMEGRPIPPSLFLTDEADVHLLPDPLADLALSSNTFPSLFPLSESTKRSLALPAAARPQPPTDPSFTVNHFLLSIPLPPVHYPLTTSTQSPLSLPALSPLLDDAALPPTPEPPPARMKATNRPPPRPPAPADPASPFAPWTVDIDEDDRQWSSAARAHLVRFIQQQSLAPLPAALLPQQTGQRAAERGAWLTAQSWMDTAAALSRLFPLPNTSLLVATVSTQPPHDPRKPSPTPAPPSPLLLHPSSPTPPPLPIVLIPPPRIIASFESDLRDFPSCTLPLWFPAGLSPLIPKDVAYVVAPPPSFPLDDTSHPSPALPRTPLDLWMEGLSSAWETAGLGRHRPLQGGKRGGTLRLRRLEGGGTEEVGGGEAPNTPSPPPTPAAASPRATSPLLLSASTPPPPTLGPSSSSSSFASALHRTPAPDGRRRYYQSIVSALLTELDATARNPTSHPPLDALIVYLVTDGEAHDVGQLADFFALLHYAAGVDPAYARVLAQLEGVDVVVHLLPLEVVGQASVERWVGEGLAVYGKVRRGLDKVESEVELDLPAEVERLWEPPWYGAWGRGQAEEGEGVAVYVLWSEVGNKLVAVGGDDRGQVMEISVAEGEEGEGGGGVNQCWNECVDSVLLLIRRHRKVKSAVVHLIHWTEDDEAELWTQPCASPPPPSQLPQRWATLLQRCGLRKWSGRGEQGNGELAMDVDGEEKGKEATSSTIVHQVIDCALQPTSSMRFLSTSSLQLSAVSTGPSSSSGGGSVLVVEGVGSVGHLMMAAYSQQWLRAVRRPPLAALLLFPSPPSDPRQSGLTRFPPPRLPVDTSHIGLLLTLQAEWSATAEGQTSSAEEMEGRSKRWNQQVESIGTQLLRSVVLVPQGAQTREGQSRSGGVVDSGGSLDACERGWDGVALPLYVTVLRRTMRLVRQVMAPNDPVG